jgi:hypothetical protein
MPGIIMGGIGGIPNILAAMFAAESCLSAKQSPQECVKKKKREEEEKREDDDDDDANLGCVCPT